MFRLVHVPGLQIGLSESTIRLETGRKLAGRNAVRMAISTVLATVRGESFDAEVVRLACQLLGSNKDKLYLLYVIEVDRGLPVDVEIAAATAKGESVLQSMEAVAKTEKFKTEGELVQARDIGSAVVREAFDKGVDAVVLGISYRERYGAFSLGKTVPYVLKNAPCRVVLWRDPISQSTTSGVSE